MRGTRPERRRPAPPPPARGRRPGARRGAGRADTPLHGVSSPAPLRPTRGHGKTPPALPWPPTRAPAGATWLPGPPSPACPSFPAWDSRAAAAWPGLAPASPTPAGSARSRGTRDPYGNQPPPRAGLGGAAAPRLPSSDCGPGCRKDPAGWPSAPKRAALTVGLGTRPLRGAEACKTANSRLGKTRR